MTTRPDGFTEEQWQHMSRELSDGVRHLMSIPGGKDMIRDRVLEVLIACVTKGRIDIGYAYMTFATVLTLTPEPDRLISGLAKMASELSPTPDPRRN